MKKSGIKKLVVITAGLALTGALLSLHAPYSARGASPGLQDTAALYKSKCASCHGADGSGATPVGKSLKLRDLRSAEVQSQTDEQLYEITAKGKGKMPGYEKSLGADKCRELVRYIRSLKQ
jgi:mono/diheme cytochrome c family protein